MRGASRVGMLRGVLDETNGRPCDVARRVGLSRECSDWRVFDRGGWGVVAPDAGGLVGLARRLGGRGEPLLGVIESMNGARFVHDALELDGWLAKGSVPDLRSGATRTVLRPARESIV